MKRTGVVALLLAVLPLAACGSKDDSGAEGGASKADASPEVVAACTDLKDGDWASLSTSSKRADLPDASLQGGERPQLPPSGHFVDYIGNVAMFGNYYAHQGYQQPRSVLWTDADVKADAARTLNTVWATCAGQIADFPDTVDDDIAEQVKEGAVGLMPGPPS